MVILVAFLLAFVASSLKPTQDANVVNDVKNQILTSLNIESKDNCKNADILVVGSYITMSDTPKEKYLSMR